MKTIKLLVVDDNRALVKKIKKYFESVKEIEVKYTAPDGEVAIGHIKEHNNEIDIIILDLVMPRIDGIEVLKYLNDKKINIKIIALTPFNTRNIIRKISEFGVVYYILKPFKLQLLKAKILNIYNNVNVIDKSILKQKDNIQIEITRILHELGVPSHIKGYHYIREGIEMVYENQEYIGSITKDLYPQIANTFGTKASRVERAIRHAIDIGCRKANWELMIKIFGYTMDEDGAKPTNSEFIVTIADIFRLEYNYLLKNS